MPTFKQIPLEELMSRWKHLPKEKSNHSLHGNYVIAIGMHGEKAISAVPLLEPYVLDPQRQSLREAAMKGLAGVPALVRALRHQVGDNNQVMLRWDAAKALAEMGPRAVSALPALEACLTDPKENINTQGDAAQAMIGIGLPAKEALQRVRDAFYARQGPRPLGSLRSVAAP